MMRSLIYGQHVLIDLVGMRVWSSRVLPHSRRIGCGKCADMGSSGYWSNLDSRRAQVR
ncbi:uncharacterized protein MYCFIDRAFT_174032 [Pseudocercospora fijiensis CIRAD86]|uniref:Uncharacterized protein n=1 Tax=Pseudocercospora fijiensis (strain CIRAD86) TaxID=383855 RepID=M3A201_PSEFD|nr:uncharacterized protein MYCFIDRAFT_174032 [Pseudocercospora fijiensis CIRAD86]EME85194.1 hypothetical protein MYCFIDRAFT_174032 [Pseudocercospora fijiensis CIRAD86]